MWNGMIGITSSWGRNGTWPFFFFFFFIRLQLCSTDWVMQVVLKLKELKDHWQLHAENWARIPFSLSF